MNIQTELLIDSINNILHTEAVTEEKDKVVTATFPNPSGGTPVRFIDNPYEEFAIVLGKTWRYYPREAFSLKQMQKDIANYKAGSTVLLDYTGNDGAESKIDRMVKATDAESLSLTGLVELCVTIGLISSTALKDMLAAGGTVNVHFWDTTKNFRYRQIGENLQKIQGSN